MSAQNTMDSLHGVIYFEFGSTTLSAESKEDIDEFCVFFQEYFSKRNVFLSLKAYSDTTGSHKYNMWLSKKRSEEVKNYLLSKNFSREMIKTYPCGETNNQKPMKNNRRVEILVTISDP